MAKKLLSDLERFFSKLRFDAETGCWVWTARLDKDGYGARFKIGSRIDGTRREVRPHRFIYEAMIGPIPEGLVPDHLCRNRACQNPWHLEPVTRLVNHQRGLRAKYLACPEGHAIEGENEVGRKGGHRCRICRNKWFAAYHKRTGHKHSKAYRQRQKELPSARAIS